MDKTTLFLFLELPVAAEEAIWLVIRGCDLVARLVWLTEVQISDVLL